ncbi:AraC family transcriptional regulator [Paenibacillus psychroresistens]|uniref:AraC family transcriptional regulator n=1 Tax=Paenibacillus psychroresistens TaxID=1778678 RepID=A0A6B8RPF6_9BACL|nr:AraC family transcriptional regulator [Paenibacillus psychroresistens]QGQ98241.1 AraC family transcriptional regulator [Paenibacillus psychroresistens]
MNKDFYLRAARDWTDDSYDIMVTPSLTAKANLHYVQEIGHYRCLASYFTERANLASYLIVYTISGKGYLQYNEKRHTLQQGQVFFISCMDYQYYETDSDELWELLWVHFDGGSSRAFYEQFHLARDPILTLNAHSPVPTLINELLELQIHQDARTELLSSQAIVQILTDLLLHTLNRNQESQTRFLPDSILQTQLFLKDQLHEKISLDRLSAQFSISKFHLAREFKKYTGLTPNEYLINLRINKAKELLKYSEIPVQEIASKVGFDNVSHFINQFKKQENATPLSFRKVWQRPK